MLLIVSANDCVGSMSLRLLVTLLIMTVPLTSACTNKSLNDIDNDRSVLNSNIDINLANHPSGGSFTVSNRNQQSLQRPQPMLSGEQQLDWAVGKSFANQAWVGAPATTTARDGLGPLFNANSCTGCHVRNGQGQLPEKGPGLIIRLGGLLSGHGEQLQDMAIPGHEPEGRIGWQSVNSNVAMANGKHYQLMQRDYHIKSLDGAVHIAASARLAPALLGMGLIDNISDADIIANSDPEDSNGDGISGRVNLRETDTSSAPRLGRFGWKASQTSLHDQVALAFFEDMGITSSLHSPPCANKTCEANNNTNIEPEISDKLLLAVTEYIANLAVPVGAHDDLSQQGYKVFKQLNCSGCHVPAFKTRLPASNFVSINNAEKFSDRHPIFETIYPFSDLLLHDMGAGLADQYPSDNTPAEEWRTAPLWGLGLRVRDPDSTRLLHDGRARSITEAILWHGGEANASKIDFTQLSEPEHTALLYFLKAL